MMQVLKISLITLHTRLEQQKVVSALGLPILETIVISSCQAGENKRFKRVRECDRSEKLNFRTQETPMTSFSYFRRNSGQKSQNTSSACYLYILGCGISNICHDLTVSHKFDQINLSDKGSTNKTRTTRLHLNRLKKCDVKITIRN